MSCEIWYEEYKQSYDIIYKRFASHTAYFASATDGKVAMTTTLQYTRIWL